MARVLFCHGLGAMRQSPLAIHVGNWAKAMGLEYENVYYTHYGNPSKVWHVDEWRAEIRQRLHPDSPVLLVSNSGGTQAALRAALDVPAACLAGKVAFAPAVRLTLDYMDRVRPGSVERLKQGKLTFHPCADPDLKIRVDLACLEDFVQNCVCRLNKKIPIHCPTRILHGLRDPLVSYNNSIKLLHQIEAKNKKLELVNADHFITNEKMIIDAMNNIYEAIVGLEEQSSIKHKAMNA